MQETKQAYDKFRRRRLRRSATKPATTATRWNGVAIISRIGLYDVTRGFGMSDDDDGRRIIGRARVRRVVYVPTVGALDNEFYVVKLAWLARLRTMLDQMRPPGSGCGLLWTST